MMATLTIAYLDGLSDEEWVAVIEDEIAAEDSIEWLFAPVEVDERQLALDLFDFEAEADDLEADRLDREYHMRGAW